MRKNKFTHKLWKFVWSSYSTFYVLLLNIRLLLPQPIKTDTIFLPSFFGQRILAQPAQTNFANSFKLGRPAF